jgi:hypothetical protein
MTDLNTLMDAIVIGAGAGKVDPPAGMMPEAALLRRLALASVQRRAGYIPQTVKLRPPAEPPPPETLPPCSENAMTWLDRINTSFYAQLIPEWCLIIAKRGKRLPHRYLARVLNMANRHPDFAPYFFLVLGERGKWMVSGSGGYKPLKAALEQAQLSNLPPLETPELPEQYQAATLKYLTDLRQQMLEDLRHE